MTVAKKVETPNISVSVTIPEKKDKADEPKVSNKKVAIVPNETFKMVYGDRWYYFTKGVKVEVSEGLKAYLKAQGALAVI